MKKLSYLSLVLLSSLFVACRSDHNGADASGTFEVDEVIVSAEVPGKILSLPLDEGTQLKGGAVAGMIDPVPLQLQKAQLTATLGALKEKTMDVRPQLQLLRDQIAVQQTQLADAQKEKKRTESLVKADAATTKQLDDWNTQIAVLQKQIQVTTQQIKVQETTTGTQNSAVLSETKPLNRSLAQINDQLRRTKIINPASGTVLTKYAMAGEITSIGKPLYKIGDLSVITLRAYITGTQLAQVKLGQAVKVMVDSDASSYRNYIGKICWISDQAEFTPKTIQTKEERANLVYAIKIRVKNDGYLKIGMYGEVKLHP